MTSLYSHDIILVLFYWIIKKKKKVYMQSLETGASLQEKGPRANHSRVTCTSEPSPGCPETLISSVSLFILLNYMYSDCVSCLVIETRCFFFPFIIKCWHILVLYFYHPPIWRTLKWEECYLKLICLLTVVLLTPDKPCLCKQCRSRSVGFSQLIWICTVCHSVCEFVSTLWMK